MMMRSRLCRALCVAVLAAPMLLGACSGGASRVEEGDATGVMHFGNATEPQGLDPHVVTGHPENNIIEALLEGLVSKDPETLAPVPGVAERWEVSEDGRTYIFHLRANARWSDGVPLTAEDFRWSWWRALMPAMGNEYSYMLFPIRNAEAFLKEEIKDFSQVGVRVIDPQTLQVELNEPTPYFLQLLAHPSAYPVPRHVIEKFGAATDRFTRWYQAGNMVSNGPFRLVDWKLNKYVRLEKNPEYWDAARVRLNAVMFYPTDNTGTEERMYRSGQLHYTYDIPVQKIRSLQEKHPEQVRLEPWLGSYYYALNVTRPGLDDVRVRKALAMSIDREALLETVMYGVTPPAYAITPPGTAGYQPPKLFDFDPEGARQLLAEAGYPDGKGMPPLEILYNTLEQHRRIAVAIQQMWKKHLNIDVTMQNQEWKVYLDTRETMNYTISRAAWIGDYVDPNSFLDMWITGGGNNKTGWSNAEYDDLVLRRIPATRTHEERMAGFYEAETILMEEMPVLPIYTYAIKHLISPSVKGMPRNIMDYVSLKHVYLEPAN